VPPQRYLEDYLELVTAIEDTAPISACRCCSKDTPRRTTRG